LESLVCRNRDAASPAAGGFRATGAQRAGATHLWVEIHGAARLERFNLPCWTSNSFCSQIEAKVDLGEEAKAPRLLCPWLGDYNAAAFDGGRYRRAVDVD
jgi:hypothetical protein